MAEMVRVNTRISSTLNDWLDKKSEESGVPKSTIVMLALEQYVRQEETFKHMGNINPILEKLEEIQKQINK